MATKSASLTTPLVDQRPRERTIEQKQRLWGWLFMSPWLVGFAIFTAFPMVASLYFSFTDFKIGQDINWVGLKNWQQLFTDPITLGSLGVTLRFGIYVLPVAILVPLALATLLTSKALVGKPFFRLFFYMPFIVPAISGIFVWQAFLNGNTGWLNRILRLFGMENPPAWTTDSHYLNTALVLIGLWGIGNALLTMMAAMTSLPTELYEAARVVGSGPDRTCTVYSGGFVKFGGEACHRRHHGQQGIADAPQANQNQRRVKIVRIGGPGGRVFHPKQP